MPPPRVIPLAWRNLTENRWRLLTSVGGTAFAVVLMFMELGFRNALLDNMVTVISHLDGELFVTSRGRYMLSQVVTFPLRRLEPAMGAADVTSAVPVYWETGQNARWRHAVSGVTRRIRILGVPARENVLDIPEVVEQRELWDRPDTALADRRSKADVYGQLTPGTVSELAGRRVTVAGTFALGTDFRSNGTVLLNESNLLKLFPERLGATRGDTQVDLGVLRTRSGSDPDAVRAEVAARLPADVIVLTKAELQEKERKFWENVTPIGVVFDIGVAMGFVVGMVICYQILFSEVVDRLSQFATLKAMGYTNFALVRFVVGQAVYIAVFGYLAGLLLSWPLASLVEGATGLDVRFYWQEMLFVLVLTLAMCTASALLAARRLRTADPAELFT